MILDLNKALDDLTNEIESVKGAGWGTALNEIDKKMKALWSAATASGQSQELAKLMCNRIETLAETAPQTVENESRARTVVLQESIFIEFLQRCEDALLESTRPENAIDMWIESLTKTGKPDPKPLLDPEIYRAFNAASESLFYLSIRTKNENVRQTAIELSKMYKQTADELYSNSFTHRLMKSRAHLYDM